MNRFRCSFPFGELKEAIRHCDPPPHVHDGDSKPLPRGYAAAKSFLRAIHHDFEERKSLVFFSALQKIGHSRMTKFGR